MLHSLYDGADTLVILLYAKNTSELIFITMKIFIFHNASKMIILSYAENTSEFTFVKMKIFIFGNTSKYSIILRFPIARYLNVLDIHNIFSQGNHIIESNTASSQS